MGDVPAKAGQVPATQNHPVVFTKCTFASPPGTADRPAAVMSSESCCTFDAQSAGVLIFVAHSANLRPRGGGSSTKTCFAEPASSAYTFLDAPVHSSAAARPVAPLERRTSVPAELELI